MKNIFKLDNFLKLIISNLILLILPLIVALPWYIACHQLPNEEFEVIVDYYEKTYPFIDKNYFTLKLISVLLLGISLTLNFLSTNKSKFFHVLKIIFIAIDCFWLFMNLQ